MKIVRPKAGTTFTLRVGGETIILHNRGRVQATIAVEASRRVSIVSTRKQKLDREMF